MIQMKWKLFQFLKKQWQRNQFEQMQWWNSQWGISFIEVVTNIDTHFFKRTFTWYSKVLFIHGKRFSYSFKYLWVITMLYLVIFTCWFIIYDSLYNSIKNIILGVPLCQWYGRLVGFLGRVFPGPWLVSLCGNCFGPQK